MDFEDEDILSVECDEIVELELSWSVGGMHVTITDSELLQLCRMRGLID